MNNICFRNVEESDFEKIVIFFKNNNLRAILRYFHPFPFTEETAYKIACEPHRDKYYIGLLDENVAGLSMLRGWDEGYIVPSLGIVVDFHLQGQGIGREILRNTLEEAHKLKCPRIRLSVYASNKTAVHLYLAFGFYEVSRQIVTIDGEPDEKIIMYKDL